MAKRSILFASFALVVIVTLAIWSVIPACGLRLPFGLGQVGLCPAAQAASPGADEGLVRRAVLLKQITEAEARLAAIACTPAEVPALSEPAQPEPAPPPPEVPLNREAIERGDVTVMQGCWALASDYRTVDPASGARVDYTGWQVCFDASGLGRETMHGSDGTTCEGEVKVRFDGGTSLVIDEPDDLPCSNGYSIYRRQVRCTVDEANTAQCQSSQPEVDGAVDVIMRRAKEQP
jgi:hypothetical protein